MGEGESGTLTRHSRLKVAICSNTGYSGRMSVEDEIRAALKRDTRNSTEMGKATGIHPVTIRHFKAGKRKDVLALERLERLAKVLGYKITLKR